MRSGAEPTAAAAAAVSRISRVYPSSSAAVIALNTTGDYGQISTVVCFSHFMSITDNATKRHYLSSGDYLNLKPFSVLMNQIGPNTYMA